MQASMNQTLWWRLRWLLLALFVSTVGALLLSVGWSYRSAQRIAKKAAQAEGYALLNALRRDLQEVKGRIRSKDLRALLQKRKSEGLRYLGLFRLKGRSLAEAGQAQGSHPFPMQPRDLLDAQTQYLAHDRLRMHALGLYRTRLRMSWRRRLRWMRFRPFLERDPSRRRYRWRRRRKRRLPPLLVVEFQSQAAQLVQAEAQRTVAVGAGAAAVLLLVMFGFAALLKRLSSMEAQRQQQQQLAVLGEMSAVLAHEIRNPLTSLKGHAQLLEEFLTGHDKLQPKAARVVEEAVRLEKLSSQLLDFVRAGSLERKPVDPVGLIRAVGESLGATQLKITAPTAPKSWQLDETRMRQVLANLLTNALQASPEGGQVEVSVAEASGELQILIDDQGPGIPEGMLESIFTPFVTTRLQGTGLGLPVARRLIELHQGRLTASNRPGGGARFAIAIPRSYTPPS